MPRKAGYDLDGLNISILQPIEQVASEQGGKGVYQFSTQGKKAMTVKQFHDLAMTERYQTPTHDDHDHLERLYWENVTSYAPIYGTDVDATLTDASVITWNINNLGTILDFMQKDYDVHIGGLITSYIYFGMWKSTFVWHTEDMDLYAINYIHYGAPKTWYAIPPAYGRKFEALANRLFPENNLACNSHLRHKTVLISPDILRQNDIPFVKTTQKAGEIIIVFPYGYHSGFNHGFNIAESANFASERWIEYGKWSKPCNCKRLTLLRWVKCFQNS